MEAVWCHLRQYISLWTGPVQSVQNAAARLIFRIRRSEHITPALISLHWLCVLESISFRREVRPITYQSIHGTSPSYLQSCFTRVADDIQTKAAVFYLTSSVLSACSSLYTVGKQAFPVSGATAWNDLPLYVASAPSLAIFKTFLFSRSYQDTIIWLTLTLLPFITTVWTSVVLAIINII